MFGSNTPGTLFVLAGAILLLISTLSTPILKSFYFLTADIDAQISTTTHFNISGQVKLGVFGYCVQLANQQTCSPIKLSYDLNQDPIIVSPARLGLQNSASLIKSLTYILVLHPIAAGLAFLATLLGALSHTRNFSRSCFTPFISYLAFIVAMLAFIFDIIAFSIVKNRINQASNSNATANAQLGNAIWTTLAGWICLIISSFLFSIGRHLSIKRYQNQFKSNKLRPAIDDDYSNKMRNNAYKAEKDRDTQGDDLDHPSDSLPTFAEYEHDDVISERIPLSRMDHSNDDLASDQQILLSDRHHSPDQPINGVGLGHLPRQRSQSTLPEKLYSNLPAHVTPASSSMSTLTPHTPSKKHRHPASLLPATLPSNFTPPPDVHSNIHSFIPYPPSSSLFDPNHPISDNPSNQSSFPTDSQNNQQPILYRHQSRHLNSGLDFDLPIQGSPPTQGLNSSPISRRSTTFSHYSHTHGNSQSPPFLPLPVTSQSSIPLLEPLPVENISVSNMPQSSSLNHHGLHQPQPRSPPTLDLQLSRFELTDDRIGQGGNTNLSGENQIPQGNQRRQLPNPPSAHHYVGPSSRRFTELNFSGTPPPNYD
ncbi:hypothetical protein O181_056610 [Austropuccinia psidii MF-1]|uniref:Pali-domain-containing protein n=1 Tax=Austropuccinia psidii MF-1 TaxID=1389203 RepID=A0A9Q3HW92_9BASI|nr:hypothetical protein [Austropuccinia psidii MF-1]